MKTIRWGILATGGIAAKLAQAITDSEQGTLAAVASRTQARADAFADQWRIPRRHGSYEQLAADPEVDVIYIATPHSHHYDHMRLCLEAGKHVLCEKALTLDARQARECIALARSKRLFLMEAMWMRFIPAVVRAKRWVDAGEIGELRMISADFCLNRPFDAAHRLFDPALGGGALLDLGIYPLSFATYFMGMPDDYTSTACLNQRTGVDEVVSMSLRRGSVLAHLSCTTRSARPGEAWLCGSKGHIKLHDLFVKADKLTVHKDGQPPVVHDVPYRSNGYLHEVEEVHDCLLRGKQESPRMTLDDSLALMQVMDAMRASWGFRYPHEQTTAGASGTTLEAHS